MEPALRLRGVTKAFGPTRAVDGMDLVVPRGMTCGFIGPSSAGNSTRERPEPSISTEASRASSVTGSR